MKSELGEWEGSIQPRLCESGENREVESHYPPPITRVKQFLKSHKTATAASPHTCSLLSAQRLARPHPRPPTAPHETVVN